MKSDHLFLAKIIEPYSYRPYLKGKYVISSVGRPILNAGDMYGFVKVIILNYPKKGEFINDEYNIGRLDFIKHISSEEMQTILSNVEVVDLLSI